jgi:archaellum biogenesis protein FlaJ (TadC family)
MQTLNNLERTFTLTREDQIYMETYERIYKRVLREAKKWKNDKYVNRVNK